MWIGRLPGKKASVTSLAFAPDCRTIYSGDTSGCVLAWDTGTHECRELYRRPKPMGRVGIYRLWPVAGGARLLFRDDFSLIDALRPEAGSLLKLEEGQRCDLRYVTPDGTRAISCDGEWRVVLWDVATGERVRVPGALGEATNVTHHILLPDGVTLLTYLSRTDELVLWDFRTGERVGELAPKGLGIIPCALSGDGTTFAVGRNQTIWAYDVPSRSLRHKMKFEKDIRELAFHPNGRLLASASTNSVVTFWDASVGTQVNQFDWQAGKVEALAFSPDGLTCAAGGREVFVVFDVDA